MLWALFFFILLVVCWKHVLVANSMGICFIFYLQTQASQWLSVHSSSAYTSPSPLSQTCSRTHFVVWGFNHYLHNFNGSDHSNCLPSGVILVEQSPELAYCLVLVKQNIDCCQTEPNDCSSAYVAC